MGHICKGEPRGKTATDPGCSVCVSVCAFAYRVCMHALVPCVCYVNVVSRQIGNRCVSRGNGEYTSCHKVMCVCVS